LRWSAKKLFLHANGRPRGRPAVPVEHDLRPAWQPKGGKLSLRAISAEMAARGVLNERGKPFNPKSVSVLLAS
jgi:hypothetical protein